MILYITNQNKRQKHKKFTFNDIDRKSYNREMKEYNLQNFVQI